MPIYEYQCEDCGEITEKLQKISDEPIDQCPHCQSEKIHRLISAGGFRLSGGGWFRKTSQLE